MIWSSKVETSREGRLHAVSFIKVILGGHIRLAFFVYRRNTSYAYVYICIMLTLCLRNPSVEVNRLAGIVWYQINFVCCGHDKTCTQANYIILYMQLLNATHTICPRTKI